MRAVVRLRTVGNLESRRDHDCPDRLVVADGEHPADVEDDRVEGRRVEAGRGAGG
jgi:hypothetical protein